MIARTVMLKPRTLCLHRKKCFRHVVVPSRPVVSTKRVNQVPKSFSSDVLLHNLAYLDIFTLSVCKNFVMIQLPAICIYRVMNIPRHIIVYNLLFIGVLKTIIELNS